MAGARDARDRSLNGETQDLDITMDMMEEAAPSESEIEQAQLSVYQDAPRRVKRETPSSKTSAVQSPIMKSEHEDTVGGDLTVKVEPGRAPKLSRTTSHRVVTGPRQLFADLPDATNEAKSTFDVILDCTYAARHLGTTEQALECDCSEEWGKTSSIYQPSRDARVADTTFRYSDAIESCLW